jgi:hypothetical protein
LLKTWTTYSNDFSCALEDTPIMIVNYVAIKIIRMKEPKQTGTKTVTIDGKVYTVRVFGETTMNIYGEEQTRGARQGRSSSYLRKWLSASYCPCSFLSY